MVEWVVYRIPSTRVDDWALTLVIIHIKTIYVDLVVQMISEQKLAEIREICVGDVTPASSGPQDKSY
jgi:hypothetical protein